jgi:hypothetical protein
LDDLVKRAIKIESEYKPFHYPGSDYTGPGTPIITNVLGKVGPNSYISSVARQHDIDYMKSHGFFNDLYSDAKAISKSFFMPTTESFAMRAGLGMRSFGSVIDAIVGTDFAGFNKPMPGLTLEETERLGNYIDKLT